LREAYPKFQERDAEVAIVTMETPKHAAELRRRYQCGFPCLSDPRAEAYRAFGLEHGGVAQVMAPRIILRAAAAALKGNYGGPMGDVFQMGGTFVIDREGVVRYCYRNGDAADNAPIEEVLAAATELDSQKL
jgi:peroxiredoxin